MRRTGYPSKQGLYDPRNEHDACGIGFVADIRGRRSHNIVRQALQVLCNLDHRGGQGCETNTGDGAGILMQIPHSFFQQVCAEDQIRLPEEGKYGVGMVFLPQDASTRQICADTMEGFVRQVGLTVLGWRDVPTNNSTLGDSAQSVEPYVRQLFIGRAEDGTDQLAFERKLYVVRKRSEHAFRAAGVTDAYLPSLSSKTIVFKGMLTPDQVSAYYTDLLNPAFETALALVHSRFSTNTFPSWERAHPYRFVIHNGEINTLRGNVNWMRARQAMDETDLFGDDFKSLMPIIDSEGSDSQMFDNCLEYLMLTGRSLPHAAMMMIPEPWSNHESMNAEMKAFYEYHSCLMEPWDGPAAICFTDGAVIGAVLDRNGLRPARYYVTKDDLIVLSSEVGVLDIPAENIVMKERLRPGRMLLVDTEKGRIVSDEELKSSIASQQPYQQWIDQHLINLEQLPESPAVADPDRHTLVKRQQAFGYTFEELTKVLEPMASSGVEAIGSMGIDTPLAILSNRPQLLYNYFKQLFAQVTNPPIDAIREELITAIGTTIGPERSLIRPEPESCRQIRLKTPILNNEELAKLKHNDREGFMPVTLPILFDAAGGGESLEEGLRHLFAGADEAINQGAGLLILSDRGMNEQKAAIPALLAVAGLHHHLIRQGTRMKVSLIVESGEPREVHHFALLLGYGASAINPYMVIESLDGMIGQNILTGVTHEKAVYQYIKAATKGIVKVLSKMGISTVQSYRGAQIFEAIGLESALVEQYFTWTPTRIEGIGLDIIAEEALTRHRRAFSPLEGRDTTLDAGGEYQYRKDGDLHLYRPETIHALQNASRTNNYGLYKQYAAMVNDHSRQTATLRGLLEFKKADGRTPVPIEEVESVEAICRRFKTGAMSYGSISSEAHETLAIAMNRIGGKSNTGEGGEHPKRFKPDANGDSRRSAIKQVASGRFGVNSHYLVNADEIQIKMAQGAKPGEGGQLPGKKVYPWIAEVRGSTPGVGLISPPPHHDIYSIEDLAELIHDLKNANPRARINVKLVSEVGVGTIAAGVAKGRADVVLISGYDGGTGASPRTSIKHAGLPWELGLAETHQTLLLNGLRDRIVVETDGKLMTGRDVVIAALLGAEEFGFSTAPLVAVGCVMMRVCHLDTCPVGVATQNPELRRKFAGDPEHVANFMRFLAQDMREIMAELGFRSVIEMIGRTDVLEPAAFVGTADEAATVAGGSPARDQWKARRVDLSALLHRPDVPEHIGRYCSVPQDHRLDESLDRKQLLALSEPAIERQEHVHAILPIRNTNRVVGTIVGSEVTRKYGAEGLPHDTIRFHFQGSAGQSFGAFIPNGMTLSLEGDANDYVGKGLSGGKIVIFPPEQANFVPQENVIIGNVAFYGATDGEAYIRGIAGERFCVRNSGVRAVVEGVGDHACEYMTGGRVVVLGPTGRNFAAGMSGGIAYVLDEDGSFKDHCNKEMVLFETLEAQYEINDVLHMIRNHAKFTDSEVAHRVLNNWEEMIWNFVKVVPRDYKRMFESIERGKLNGLDNDEAVMAAFKENQNDLSRVSGN